MQARRGPDATLVTPLICVPYLAATWSGGHRPAMAAIVAVLALGAAVLRRHRTARHVPALIVSTVGYAALGVLDGGVAAPLGALLPFSVMVYAATMPPRAFALAAALSATAYWTVAIAGAPAPTGYAAVYTVAFGGISFLCLRYSVAMASLRRRLDELSQLDPLTGCLNRRGFDARLAAAVAEADRTGEPIVLLRLDLDRFKQVNDTYGHQAGDELLAWTARTLKSQLRTEDAVGRVGGDEFAAVLTGPDAETAAAVVDRVRTALNGVAAGSLGFACYPAEATGIESLHHRADQRVYADKEGRDRRLPGPDAVARARAAAAPRQEPRVSRHERRRRAIADSGRLGMVDPGVGLFYVALFAEGHPHRLAMGVLLGVAGLIGLATLRLAGPLSRHGRVGPAMFALGVVQFGIAAAVVCLDGGADATLALGLFAPLPLIALTTPSVGRPLLAAIVVGYLGIAVSVDHPDPWYVAMHLAGALGVSALCGHKGRIAARRRRQLSELSRTDPLTGCLNRRGFTERFAAERPAALVLLDLDGFKQVNDAHGHAAGDDLLIWVAATLRDRVQPGGVVGRLGGDEFVVLPGPDPAADPGRIAETLRGSLAERTACSVGVAVPGEHGEDFDALYAHADAELYARKAARSTGAPTAQR
ncbi:diguanylate cyclase [Actinoplanes sp. NPDC049681]|uniref:diguanylate cyclase n=1 Tax=Actinoplanes sp. NPDC049681 TaxID=3363905 RepID=UPI0037B6A151